MPEEKEHLGNLVRKDALDAATMMSSLGGVRGIIESAVPSLVFVIAYTLTRDLALSAMLTIGSLVILGILRVIAKGSLTQVYAGAFVAAIGLVFALFTGRAGDNFVPGMIYNGVLVVVFLISILVRVPFVGLIMGSFESNLLGWRNDPYKRKAFSLTTWVWIGVMVVRLSVMVPFYLASRDSGDVLALGIAKIATGLPLFAIQILLSWIIIRPAYVVAEQRLSQQDQS